MAVIVVEVLSHRPVLVAFADDHVVDDGDVEHLAAVNQPGRQRLILVAWRRIAGRMVVGQDDRLGATADGGPEHLAGVDDGLIQQAQGDEFDTVAENQGMSHFQLARHLDAVDLALDDLFDDVRGLHHALDGLVDRNTVCLVGIVGTTEYGMVDPVARLSDLAEERDVFLHIDAAFGGMVVPFLDRPIPFDFRLSGVDSISVDPHKMGMSTIPAGCLLVRDPDYFSSLNVETPYLTVKRECTLAGTRPGASVAAAFAVLEYLGMDGMRAVVAGCMENTRRLIEGMETFGCPRAVTPDVNVATFSCDRPPAGWRVSRTRAGHMRIVCMPHVTRDVIEAFLNDMSDTHA